MNTVAVHQGAPTLTMMGAILLYGDYSRKVAHATIHGVVGSKKGPVIQPGENLTREALEAALVGLANTAGSKTWRYVEDRALAAGPSMVAWWSPACVRHVHFAPGNRLMSGPAAQPAMLWIVDQAGKRLSVFCLKEDRKPSPDTMLYHSIHYNVWLGGTVCIGSAVTPPDLKPQSWEGMFYGSSFTHPNTDHTWQCKTRGGVTALWKRLMRDAGKTSFPVDQLKPTGRTLDQLLSEACR